MSKQKEKTFPCEGECANGTESGYSVEARYTGIDGVEKFGDQTFGEQWKRVLFAQATNGIPTGPSYHYGIHLAHLLSYPAAEALRWWFHAHLATEPLGDLCFDTRIVKHKVEWSWKTTELSAHQVKGSEDRSSCIPDWNTK